MALFLRLRLAENRCLIQANWWSWSGSNRRPPECKSGALPAELQPLLGVRSQPGPAKKPLVGLGRLELPTSPLSGVRSSHLSYRPERTQNIIEADWTRTSNDLHCRSEVNQTLQVEIPEQMLSLRLAEKRCLIPTGLERLLLTSGLACQALPGFAETNPFGSSSHCLS